ncbi:MAG: hypothetical protein ACOZQL_28875 [Myxococcota bacterium]
MEQRLRGIDIVGIVVALVCLVEAIVGVAVQPSYRRLFEDFSVQLPALTRFVLHPLSALLPALVPAIVVGEGIARRRSERGMVARVVVAIALMLIGPALFLIGSYLPIFTVAGAVK